MAEINFAADTDASAAPFEIERADKYSRYLLHARTEILAVLRSLIQKAALITVHFDQGKSFLLTSMLTLSDDGESYLLDLGADEEMNRKALLAKKLILTALVDKVKIQFHVDSLSLGRFEGSQAFVGKCPAVLLRLQRREFFRLPSPLASPVTMSTVIQRLDGSAMNIELPVFDISGGGVGLMASDDIARLLPCGKRLTNCRIKLSNEELLVVDLVVRNTFDATTRNGHRFIRTGCEFIDIPAARLNMLQRYIIRIERERKARASGLN